MVRLGKVSIAFKTFGVCDFSRLAVTDWRSQRWRLWFLALMTATHSNSTCESIDLRAILKATDSHLVFFDAVLIFRVTNGLNRRQLKNKRLLRCFRVQ